MADTIKLKGGKLANMPALSEREVVIATDEQAIYAGINGKNVRIAGADDKSELEGKLTATPAASQAAISTGSSLADVISAHNALISALKASGIMK